MKRRLSSLLLAVALGLALPAWAGRAVVEWEYDYVNVRGAPDLGAATVGRLTAGAEAETLETREEWVRVRFPGGEGWVVSRSLRELHPAEPSTAVPPQEAGPAAVELPAASLATEPPPAPPRVAESVLPPPVEAPVPSATDAVDAVESERPGGYLSQYDTPGAPLADATPSLWSVLSGLLLVLALVALAVYGARRLLGNRLPVGRRPNGIRVLASRPVGPRQGLLLVEVGGLVWLIGQGQDGLRPIAEIRDEAALRRLHETYAFLETPFEAELRREVDLESQSVPAEEGPAEAPAAPGPGNPTREDRLAALRRQRPNGGS